MTIKQTLALLVLCILAGTGANARSFEKGDVVISAAGIVSPLGLKSDWGEFYIQDQTQDIQHDAKLGKPGVGGELQAVYFFHPRFAAGISASDQHFAKDKASGWEVNVGTHQKNLMLGGQIFINPESEYKVYLPFSAGWNRSRVSVDFGGTQHFKYTGFAYRAGIGVMHVYNRHWALGLEARYNGNQFHDSHYIASNGNRIHLRHKMNFVSGVLRLNYIL